MKRKLIGVILMAVMVCSLAACGSKETNVDIFIGYFVVIICICKI